MKIPFLKNTEPRRFYYTPIFSEEEKNPISKRLINETENKVPLPAGERDLGSGAAKFRFERKAKQHSLLTAGMLRLLFPLLLLAAIAYFCLIIFGR